MRRLLRDRHRLALDEGTAERLLAGRLDPSNAPPGYAAAAAVLAAASAPPDAEELASEAAIVAAFAAAARSHSPHLPTHRRSRVFTKLLTVKAAVAVLGVLVGGGVAAAATGNLPAPAQQAAHALLGGARVPAPAQDTATTRAHPVGPDAAGPAALGLCRAWSAGQASQASQHGKKLDAAAFAALAKAAGGSDQIAAYCAKVTASAAGGPGQGQGGRPGNVPPSTAAGPGQGQGGPPSSLPANSAGGPGQGQGNPPSSVPASTAGGSGHGQGGPPSSVPASTIP
jgi:hypothetical protein